MTPIATRIPTRPSGSVVGVAVGAAVLVASAGHDDGLVLCPFRRCTGGYCPGCGATRAANRLVRGDPAASWAHHPWVLLAAVQLVALVGWSTLRRDRARPLPTGLAPTLGTVNAVALFAIWVVRLGSGAIPSGWL